MALWLAQHEAFAVLLFDAFECLVQVVLACAHHTRHSRRIRRVLVENLKDVLVALLIRARCAALPVVGRVEHRVGDELPVLLLACMRLGLKHKHVFGLECDAGLEDKNK